MVRSVSRTYDPAYRRTPATLQMRASMSPACQSRRTTHDRGRYTLIQAAEYGGRSSSRASVLQALFPKGTPIYQSAESRSCANIADQKLTPYTASSFWQIVIKHGHMILSRQLRNCGTY